MVANIDNVPYILRPANYPYGNPGRGWKIYEKENRKIGVINAIGQFGFNRIYPENPYRVIPKIIEKISLETNTIIVDYHAVATAEKITMSYIVDGKISALIGTHTKVATADERILPGGLPLFRRNDQPHHPASEASCRSGPDRIAWHEQPPGKSLWGFCNVWTEGTSAVPADDDCQGRP